VSEQSIVLKSARYEGVPGLFVSGGSPRAVLWSAYRLVEHWGVRYLLHGDKLPSRREFTLPELDVVEVPALPIRAWRVVNDFAGGPESWGMEDYRKTLDQLAKLTFNRVFISTWTYQPFLDLTFRGVRRESAYLWFDEHFPITDDMIGRELFGDEAEFWNPDLPLDAPYEEFAAAGEQLIHSIVAHSHGRGMECAMAVNALEFMPEFAPLLKDARRIHQLKELTIVPGESVSPDDPDLMELSGAVLRTAVDTYPEMDFINLGMPEFRQWTGEYERAWRALDAKYGIQDIRSLDDVVESARRRGGDASYSGGNVERALDELKGDIVMLYYYDRLLTERQVLAGTARPDMRIQFTAVAEELNPVLDRILPSGSELLQFIDYTPSRIVSRRQALEEVPTGELPSVLIYTLHDDNVGIVPQLETQPLHELTLDLRKHGWAGFQTRYWLMSDHDPCVSYLDRAAWDRDVTPESAYAEHVRCLCGPDAVGPMLEAFGLIEEATHLLEEHELGFTFAVHGMMMKHWTPGSLSDELRTVRELYRRAEDRVRTAHDETLRYGPELSYTGYWINRLAFGRLYIDAVEQVREAATAESEGNPSKAAELAATALTRTREALGAFALAVQDRSDLGTLAVLNEYVYRPLEAKVADLEQTARRMTS